MTRIRTHRKGYTLIELLTVMAITAVLLTVIVVPVFQSFNLLRAGQGFSEAQERARILLDRIGREISNSVGVRDNSGLNGAIQVTIPSTQAANAPLVSENLEYAKLDIVKPAEGNPQVDSKGNPILIDPVTGKVDPTLKVPKGQVVLPASSGATIIRYFIGLRDPFAGATAQYGPGLYNNPYDGLLMPRNGSQDNLYVLYRAEVQPYVYSNGGYIANNVYFDVNPSGQPILDDPAFFVPDGTLAKANRVAAWKKAAVVQTELSRYDMIMPVSVKSTTTVIYDGTFPRLTPLIQFRPTHISDEPSTQMRTVRLGEESDNAINTGADVIRTDFGSWSNITVKTVPEPLNQVVNPGQDPFLIAQGTRDNTGSLQLLISADNPVSDPNGTATVGLFDGGAYGNAVNAGYPYPFTAAVQATVGGTSWLGTQGLRDLFAPYTVDPAGGKLLASFGINEVGTQLLKPTPGDPSGTRPNLPHVLAGNGIPQNDPGTPVYQGSAYTINSAFDYLWNQHPQLRGSAISRFIDLRVTPNEDGTYGPLFPDNATNPANANVVLAQTSGSFKRATIVAGSEVIYGPDQNPGPNFGNEIRYTRTTREPGPNQYRINYIHQQEPASYTDLGLTNADLAGFNPATYDATNFVSAAIQARYMPGYVELNSDPTVALPNTVPFKISYRFQFTGPHDSFAIDYDSRQVMSLLLTIRNFPQTSLPNAQSVTLKTTATVRNFLR